MKENIQDNGRLHDPVEDHRIPTHGGTVSRLSSRAPRESLGGGTGRDEVGD